MAQSYLRNPSIERLPAILEELHTGALRIPPFQRDFEWTGEQRLALCNSVALGLPTGSLLVWRTKKKLTPENPVGPYQLIDSQLTPQYLLDGRQRMTTLYASLAAAFWTREGLTPPSPSPEYQTPPDGSSWAIYYDLTDQQFVLEPRKKYKPDTVTLSLLTEAPTDNDSSTSSKLLPLAVLFDDGAYDDWREGAELTRELVNRARAVRTAFTDYQIPVVPIATDDIGVVTLAFKRLNTGGTRRSESDMARALAWSEGFDLKKHINALRERLQPAGWGEVEEDTILKVVAVVANIEPTEADPEQLAAAIRRDPRLVEVAGLRIGNAASFLAERVGIVGPDSLPYRLVLVFAARAFHVDGGSLSAAQERGLAAWIAEACIAQRFGGAPPHQIQADWRALAHRLSLSGADLLRPHTNEVFIANECWRFSMRWARSLVTALVLADQEPMTGEGIPFLHPHALVSAGSDNVGMLIAAGGSGLPIAVEQLLVTSTIRGAGLRSPANRVICPRAQLPELRRGLFQGGCSADVLKSHLISEDAHAALLRGDIEQFFEARRDAIREAELRWVESRGGRIDLRREPRAYIDG
jgi:Protein of unknown function DUF262